MLDRRRRTVSWTFARARLEDGAGVCTNIGKILGNTMVFKPLATSHNPNLTAYDADGGRPGTGEGSPWAPAGAGSPHGRNAGQRTPWRRQIWFFLALRVLPESQVHWLLSARGWVETPETSTHLPLWTATSW